MKSCARAFLLGVLGELNQKGDRALILVLNKNKGREPVKGYPLKT
jgi:hypothetical protein